MKDYLKTLFGFFAILGILFIPFTYFIWSFQPHLVNAIFVPFLSELSKTIFSEPIDLNEISSDSGLHYLLMIFIFLLSVLFSLLFYFSKFSSANKEKLNAGINGVMLYFLSLQLLKYGFDKIFGHQFYQPEPNILFTPFGKLDKDILYWSTMGTSYEYSLFMGMAEITAGSLLLIKKTRMAGLILSIFILVNVVAVNFSFDISVKLFSLFLLFLSCLLISPYAVKIFRYLSGKTTETLTIQNSVYENRPLLRHALKFVALSLMTLEIVLPNLLYEAKSLHKPFLAGAYEVKEINPFVKRFFIHKDGFVIFQTHEDDFLDYKLDWNLIKKEIILTDYTLKKQNIPFVWNKTSGTLTFSFHNQHLTGLVMNHEILPVLSPGFHWMADH